MEERGFKIFVPEEEEPGKDSRVFYNRDMLNNRDLSEIAGKVFREEIDVEKFHTIDALAASGIRGFRYAGFSDELVINDANPEAVESIEKGLEENGIDAGVYNQDANVMLSENRNRFHFVDLDPFGSFLPFLDSASRAMNHQSFLGVTATDNAVPGGSYPETCKRRYGSKPLKTSFMHETGLRIYIREIFENLARYDKAFDPKVSWHEQHYTRVMGRVTESKRRTNRLRENIGYMTFCQHCLWRGFERRDTCPECGESAAVAGPLWTGKFVDRRFTEKMLEKFPEDWESRELLERIHEEAEILTPFYDLHRLASNMNISSPQRDEVLEAIEDRGYPVARTHFSPTGFRTDAPIDDIKEIIRENT